MGGAMGQLGMVAMGLIGLVGVLRARSARRRAATDPDTTLAARLEMERRMASYLAARDDTTSR